MSTIKTAISIENALFHEVENLAKEKHISRSEIFSNAVKEFIEKQKNLKILSALNKIYAKGPTEEEKTIQRQALKHTLKVIDPW